MYERSKGFITYAQSKASYGLALEIINALKTISSTHDGYYHYYFTTVRKDDFAKSFVKFKELKNGYNFIINNHYGFTITQESCRKNFIKLIDNVPILLLYDFSKASFNGECPPIDAFDFISSLYDFSGSTLYGKHSLMIIKIEDDQMRIRIDSEKNNEKIFYSLHKSAYTIYESIDLNSRGKIEMKGEYEFSVFQLMNSIVEYLRDSSFLDENIYMLAPNGISYEVEK